jgi:hypothetical protein
MELTDVVKQQSGSIIVIDDDFSPPNFDMVAIDDITAQYQFLESNGRARTSLAGYLGIPVDTEPEELVKQTLEAANRFWDDYLKDPASFSFLEPLLGGFRSEYQRRQARINGLVEFLKNRFNVVPQTYWSLDQAKPHMKDCVLAFIDLFIDANDERRAIVNHSQLKDEMRTSLTLGGEEWPKLIFLISSRLPGQQGLDSFRVATGIKSAFFLAIDKKDITDSFLERTIDRCLERYGTAVHLNHYLVSVEAAIKDAADSLIKDVSKLELHDLTALNVLRLDSESESLQSYLTWFLSEALGVKLRNAASLRRQLLPKEAAFIPLDGQLLPKSVLFELFSEIVIAPSAADSEEALAFGDILEDRTATAGNLRNLLLVIAPACDLIRCDNSYEVICVRGTLDSEGASLAGLLDKKYAFGKGHLVLRRPVGADGQPMYGRVTWDKKRLCTVAVSQLKDTERFGRVARLSEVFAQEIKELSLANLARIGTPIDPPFSVAMHCMVRLKLAREGRQGDLLKQEDLSDRDYLSAIVTMGRDADEPDREVTKMVVFSHQFQDWLISVCLDEAIREAGTYAAKLQNVKEFFENQGNLRVPLKKDKVSKCNGFLSIGIRGTAPAEDLTERVLEVILWPC